MPDPSTNPERTFRLRPAHQPVRSGHGQAIIIFLTVCTKHRKPRLATPYFHQLLKSAWQLADRWLVGRYVIMPDHLHLFCAPGQYQPESLGRWIRYWKGQVSKAGRFKEGELWQPDHWDTQLRSGDSYEAKWNYVRANPVRAGLVRNENEWPFKGELSCLRWRA